MADGHRGRLLDDVRGRHDARHDDVGSVARDRDRFVREELTHLVLEAAQVALHDDVVAVDGATVVPHEQ